MNQKTQIHQVQVRTKVKNLETIIGTQVLFYCYTNNIWLNKSEFDTFIHIALNGYEGSKTLDEIVKRGIFKSQQCVRNARGKLVKYKLLVEPEKRVFKINPALSIINSGVVLYDMKIINVDDSKKG